MGEKMNKFSYNSVIQYRYNGGAWEDVMEYYANESKSARLDIKEYKFSVALDSSQAYRLINRRVLNPDYKG